MGNLSFSTDREDINNFLVAGQHPNESRLPLNVRSCFINMNKAALNQLLATMISGTILTVMSPVLFLPFDPAF